MTLYCEEDSWVCAPHQHGEGMRVAARGHRVGIAPITLRDANAFVVKYHRHHKAVCGHKFAISVRLGATSEVCGVAIVGRPVSRMLDDGNTLEILRVCTDGTHNACSMLYGAARRAGFAMGYARIITYTLATESGASLRAAGFLLYGRAGGGAWSRRGRPRKDIHPLDPKLRWEVVAGSAAGRG